MPIIRNGEEKIQATHPQENLMKLTGDTNNKATPPRNNLSF